MLHEQIYLAFLQKKKKKKETTTCHDKQNIKKKLEYVAELSIVSDVFLLSKVVGCALVKEVPTEAELLLDLSKLLHLKVTWTLNDLTRIN